MDLKQLKAQYKEEQYKIAKDRKLGKFKSKEEDVDEQEKSWVNFLVRKYEITGEEIDRAEAVGYFENKLKSKYVDIRDSFLNEEISEKDYFKKRIDLFTDFEDNLSFMGLVENKTTKKERQVFLDTNWEIERVEKGAGNLLKRAELCIKQTPAVEEYFTLLKTRNEIQNTDDKIQLQSKEL